MARRPGDVYSPAPPMEPLEQPDAWALSSRDIPKATGCLNFLRYGMELPQLFLNSTALPPRLP
jgi:hypothetical protein